MTEKSRIIAFGTSENSDNRDEELLTDESNASSDALDLDAWEDTDEPVDHEAAPDRGWIVPALAAFATLAWTGFFAWANSVALSEEAKLSQLTALIGDWSLPVLLIGVAWLLFMRTSRREAGRFGDAARLLSDESAQLESRLINVNRELSLAREFIASQSRDLESLGRVASERLSQNADRLQSLIRENGLRVESIGTVSEAALENMEKLRGQLPVIASSAKDVTNNIGNAGRTAHSQLEDMVSGFKRINEFGQACEQQVHNLRSIVDGTLEGFTSQCEKLDEIAGARFAELNERSDEFRTQLEKHEIEAMAAIRSRAAALSEEMAETRVQLDDEEAQCLTSLRNRLAFLRDEGTAVSRSLRDGEAQASDGWRESLARIEEDKGRVIEEFMRIEEAAAEAARERGAGIADEIARVKSQIAESRKNLDDDIQQRRQRSESEDHAALERLKDALAEIDTELAQRSQKLAEAIETRRNAAEVAQMATVAQFEQTFTRLDTEMAERSQQLSDGINARRQATEEAEAEAMARFGEIFIALDSQYVERTAGHEQRTAALTSKSENLVARLAEFEDRITAIANNAEGAENTIASSLTKLTERLSAAQMQLTGTSEELDQVTEGSVRLLELVQASANHSREELPLALAQSQDVLSNLESKIVNIRETLSLTGSSGAELTGKIEESSEGLKTVLEDFDRMQAVMNDNSAVHQATLESLRDQLSALEEQSDRLTEKARHDLSEAIQTLDHSARNAVSALGSEGAGAVSALAERLGDESAEAIDRAMRARAAEASGQLEQAAAHAAGVSREATVQLRDQLAMVNELVGNLEQRVARAREQAEEKVDNDFARRAALITESLNSNAIDIAKALSTDVSDTAWASYLKGDRGIFTRRAVNLIETNDIKAIQQIFERDPGFREHVSRYIHDFEAILRQVLSTRDGNAMGVTLLSSDMGKLYVALAQAIERLRS